ncbi:transcription elongation factor GreA [Candidatus Beckwithbacteria bacterium RBG_13_42_9]|uniref:Transcription elongation factor GreA n=1 Tax=Candidatus Beckwithbacteria bacterium RBG_13_42_9 TaxID=1797457 RepID=A0A1F5E931_9BACT|nr:MAG: transcription elongation factor GreA [Candidatus Beckwithbacteria bacterium RBG_13_42_9]
MNNQLANKTVFLTKNGLNDLQKELDSLREKKKPALIQRVARARGFGDLSENTEYSTAREELAFVEGRIDELEDLMAKVKVIQAKNGKTKNKVVALGCKVTVHVNGQEHTYEVVGEWEADPLQKRISHSSPLGRALLGKKVGDIVEIEAPAGRIVYRIKKIH